MVQWENENSASVVNEKKTVGAVELKGTTVNISTSTNKGRVAIYKATIYETGLSGYVVAPFFPLIIDIFI